MTAWDYTKTEYDKQAKADPVWRLERLINYGLNGETLNPEELKQYLPQLNIPQERREFWSCFYVTRNLNSKTKNGTLIL